MLSFFSIHKLQDVLLYLVFDTRINIIIVIFMNLVISFFFCDAPPVPVNEKLHTNLDFIESKIKLITITAIAA